LPSRWYTLKLNILFLEDPTCISEDNAEEYVSNLNGDFRLTTYIKEYNFKKNIFETIPFDFYFTLVAS